jgi:hypothetical protein
MDENQQVSSWLPQIGNYVIAEVSVLDIRYTRDHSRLVGSELGIVDERDSIGDGGRVRWEDDTGTVASPILSRATEGTVCREIHCGDRHVPAPLCHEGAELPDDPCACSH